MADTKKSDEIKKEIEGIEKQLKKPGIAEGLKKALESALTGAKAAYQKALASETKPATEKKKQTPKPKEKPAEKKQEDEDEKNRYMTVFYKGKERTYDLENCDEAKEAMVARKERDKESNEKTKSRLPITAAVKSIEHATAHIIDAIPANADPVKVMKGLQAFENYFDKAVDALKQAGFSQTSINKLKDAIDGIQQEAKDILKNQKKDK